jgi:protein involved in polysaccharide export with SLBB domain
MKSRVNGANGTIVQQIYLRFLLVMSLLVVSSSVWSQANPIAEPDVSYRLGAGDKLQINVFNQADLSGEYTLDGNGRFTMHLIGKVEAANLTPTELEILLVSKLKPDYLVNPRVSVRMKNFRPFYIMGEVTKPASYDYVDGMTYLTAVAIAGGYTYRGKKNYVYVTRSDDPERIELKLEVGEKVQPGDIIRVAERLF